jgi:hypothetical protein
MSFSDRLFLISRRTGSGRAFQKTRPITYRAKVLGRALLSARSDANRFWMLLSGNAEVAFPSRTATIAAAANLPTPATSTSTTDVAAFASHVTIAATAGLPTAAAATTATSATTPSTASPSDAFRFAPTIAAANVATLSPCQKRKARS